MLLTSSSVNTVKFNFQIAKELDTCQKVTTFYDAGRFIVYGWKDDKFIVQSHVDSAEEYMRIRFGGTPYAFPGDYKEAFRTMSVISSQLEQIRTFLAEVSEFLSVRNLGKNADKLGKQIVDHFFTDQALCQNVRNTKELLANVSEFFLKRNLGKQADTLRNRATNFIQDLDREIDNAESIADETNRFSRY